MLLVPRKTESRETRGPSIRKAAFLIAYSKTGNIRAAAETIGLDRNIYHIWVGADPEFAAAAKVAHEEAMDRLEEHLFKRASGAGVRTKKTYTFKDGVRALSEETIEEGPSDTAAIFLLKGGRPEKYRERVDVNMVDDAGLRKMAEAEGIDPDEVIRIAHQWNKQSMAQAKPAAALTNGSSVGHR